MISTNHSAAPLPWLAAAVLALYVALFAFRFIMPPASVKIEILTATPSAAGK
jgi:hypothetical protein